MTTEEVLFVTAIVWVLLAYATERLITLPGGL